MLLSWFSPTLVALPNSRVQAEPALAGGAAALRVWGVLLIDSVQQQARGWPRQVGVAGLSGLLLRGLAEPFLLVARGPHVAAVTKVQGPIQSVVDESTELFEVVVVAPIAHTHLDARVAREAAMPARRLVLAVGEGAALLAAVIFQQLLLTVGILVQEGPRGQLPKAGHRAAGLHSRGFGGCWVGWHVGGLRVSDDAWGSRAASAGPRQGAALRPLGAPGGIGARGAAARRATLRRQLLLLLELEGTVWWGRSWRSVHHFLIRR